MRLLLKRLWCRALGHGAPWVTIRALDRRYHLCPRCGRNVFEPASLPDAETGGSDGDAE